MSSQIFYPRRSFYTSSPLPPPPISEVPYPYPSYVYPSDPGVTYQPPIYSTVGSSSLAYSQTIPSYSESKMYPSYSPNIPAYTQQIGAYTQPVTYNQQAPSYSFASDQYNESPPSYTPAREIQTQEISSAYPPTSVPLRAGQTIQSNYQPVYQSDYEAIKDRDAFYRGQVYDPIDREALDQRYQVEEAIQADKRREMEYQRWRNTQSDRIFNAPDGPIRIIDNSIPIRPSIPLASSFVLQPSNYSDLRQTISNYEESNKFSTEAKFKSMKQELARCSYTYSQMVNTLLHNFRETLLALKEIEACKNQLIARDDFNVRLFYTTLNNHYNDKILSADQLKLAMEALNFTAVDISDIQLLFAKYSNERSADFLSLNDFKKLLIPFYLNSRRAYELEAREDVQEMSIETQRIAGRVLRMHMNLENSQEYSRQMMQKRLIDLAYCYDYIDRERKGVLNNSQISTFLQANEVYSNPDDVNLIIQRFNNAYPIGPLQEHVITLNEFIYELTPKSTFPYYKEQ